VTPRAVLELAHHHPGRLRVRSDALRGGPPDSATNERLARIRTALDGMIGVRSIRLNASAGSVLVEYEPGAVDPNALIDVVAHSADLEAPPADDEPATRGARPTRRLIDAARELNDWIERLTGGRADLRALIPLTMTGLSAYSFLIHENDRLPRWDNLAYWAFSLFQSLHASEIADREGPEP
jgi:Heavy metal associated domain 2